MESPGEIETKSVCLTSMKIFAFGFRLRQRGQGWSLLLNSWSPLVLRIVCKVPVRGARNER